VAITSVGYAGTVTDADWRGLATKSVSNLYGVEDFAAWRVTAASGDRRVSVAPGTGYGLGVLDVSSTAVLLQSPTVASGSRWDLIAAHRNWATGVTSFKVITGSATKQIPTRDTGYGGENDQPIALVRYAAGQTAPQEIVDLRCVAGDGGLIAFDALALQYLTRLGTHVRINGESWVRKLNSSNSPVWTSDEVTARDWSLAHIVTAARTWLTKHIAEEGSNGRTRLTTHATSVTAEGETSLGLSPLRDTGTTMAFWVGVHGAATHLFRLYKSGLARFYGDMIVNGNIDAESLDVSGHAVADSMGVRGDLHVVGAIDNPQLEDTGWVTVPRRAGWNATPNYPVQVRRIGSVVHLRGAVTSASTGSVLTIVTVPSGFRPADDQFLGAVRAGGSDFTAELLIQPSGLVGVPSSAYYTGSFPVGAVMPLHGSWILG
jgi:hypothetical protein